MDLPSHLSPDNKDISCNTTEVKPFDQVDSKKNVVPSDILGEWIWKNDKQLDENNASLFDGVDCDEVVGNDDIAERRRFFQKEKNRKKIVFKPGKLYHFEVRDGVVRVRYPRSTKQTQHNIFFPPPPDICSIH